PPGPLSSFTCPDCGGPLFELKNGELDRYRCRSGHAFSAESMAAGQADAIEEALWVAVNTLNESTLLSERMARDGRHRGHDWVAERFEKKRHEMERRAGLLRGLLRTINEPTMDEGEDGERST